MNLDLPLLKLTYKFLKFKVNWLFDNYSFHIWDCIMEHFPNRMQLLVMNIFFLFKKNRWFFFLLFTVWFKKQISILIKNYALKTMLNINYRKITNMNYTKVNINLLMCNVLLCNYRLPLNGMPIKRYRPCGRGL